jgi:hypothetical protein
MIAGAVVVLLSVLAALYVPPGLALTVFGDGLQTLLTGLTLLLALQNIRKSHARLRIYNRNIRHGAREPDFLHRPDQIAGKPCQHTGKVSKPEDRAFRI